MYGPAFFFLSDAPEYDVQQSSGLLVYGTDSVHPGSWRGALLWLLATGHWRLTQESVRLVFAILTAELKLFVCTYISVMQQRALLS